MGGVKGPKIWQRNEFWVVLAVIVTFVGSISLIMAQHEIARALEDVMLLGVLQRILELLK